MAFTLVNSLSEADWRQFVNAQPQSSIFHTPEMCAAFARAPGHHFSLWAALNDAGQPVALLLPVSQTLFNGPWRAWTTRTVVYGSVLCAPGPESRAALPQLLAAYTRQARTCALFTELRNTSDLGEWQPLLAGSGFVYEPHLNYLIDLTQPEKTLWQNVRANARRNVQKARKVGVVIDEIRDPARLPEVYAILKAVYQRLQVPLPEAEFFQAAYELLAPNDQLRVWAARLGETCIGALTLLQHNGVLLYWYTGTLREYSAHRANDLLVWQALEWGHRQGYRLFDFGGAGRPDEPYGVRDFKAKYGGELVEYGRNVCVHSRLRLQVGQLGYRLLRRVLYGRSQPAASPGEAE